MKQDLRVILDKIKEYETIMIFGHIKPDGDCLGSQFGLKDIIVNTWPRKKVHVIGETSEWVNFLGTPENNVPGYAFDEALGIVVDCGSSDRISDDRYKYCKELIKIDHHHPVGDYGDYVWVEVDWPACAQMIAFFYKTFEKELRISQKGAEALYVGMLTDTSSFRYRGVNELTFKLAGMLLSLGVEVDYIDSLLNVKEENMVDYKGYLLSHMVKTEGFIYFVVTDEIRRKFDLSYEQAAGLVNELGGIKGFPIWALIIQYPTEYRVRIRSANLAPNVHEIAEQFGGGGHDHAAGFSIPNLEGGIRDIKYAVNKTLEEFYRTKKFN